jgi:hypothetical protein
MPPLSGDSVGIFKIKLVSAYSSKHIDENTRKYLRM